MQWLPIEPVGRLALRAREGVELIADEYREQRCELTDSHEWHYRPLMDVSVCLKCSKVEDGNIKTKEEVLYGYKLKFEVIKERRPRVKRQRRARTSARLASARQRLSTARKRTRRVGHVGSDKAK